MRVADVQGHHVRSRHVVDVLRVAVVRDPSVSKRPRPRVQGVGTLGQAQIGERRGVAFAHRTRCEGRLRRGEHVHDVVHCARATVHPRHRQGEGMASELGQFNARDRRTHAGGTVWQRPLVGLTFEVGLFSVHGQGIASLRVGQGDVGPWFGLHHEVVNDFRRAGLRLVVQAHSHRQVVFPWGVVGPNHVARLRRVPVLIGAVEVPLKEVGVRGGGCEFQAFAFARLHRTAHVGGQGLTHDNGDGLFVHTTVVLDGQRDGVLAHLGEGEGHRVGIDPRPPVDFADSAGAVGAAQLPALLALLRVSVGEAHALRHVPQIDGVVGPAQHGGRRVDQGVVLVPNVDVVDGHCSRHPKLGSPACVGGGQGDFALASCGEGIVQVADRGSFVLGTRRHGGAVVEGPGELGVRCDVGRAVDKAQRRRSTIACGPALGNHNRRVDQHAFLQGGRRRAGCGAERQVVGGKFLVAVGVADGRQSAPLRKKFRDRTVSPVHGEVGPRSLGQGEKLERAAAVVALEVHRIGRSHAVSVQQRAALS